MSNNKASRVSSRKELDQNRPDVGSLAVNISLPILTSNKQQKVYTVLILGDGNFSFSLALADAIWGKGTSKSAADELFNTDTHDLSKSLYIVSTSFDDKEELMWKYPETLGILDRLKKFNHVQVIHGINAWQLQDHFRDVEFRSIIWNHPHLGVEDFRLHKFLMAHFFHSTAACLAPSGFVSISLVKGQAERWDITPQAIKKGFYLSKQTPFEPSHWYGYHTKRNRTGQSFQNQHTQKHMKSSMSSEILQFHFNDKFQQKPDLVESSSHNPDSKCPNSATAVVKYEDKYNIPKAAPLPAKFACPHCAKYFPLKRGLQTHIRQVHELKKYGDWKPSMPKKFKCESCDKKFHDSEALWQHTISKHSSTPVPSPQQPLTLSEEFTNMSIHYIPCPVCGQAIPDYWHIEQHLEMLKPLIGIRATCKLCSKVFTEHRALDQHLNFCRVSIPAEMMVRRKQNRVSKELQKSADTAKE
eukprot:gene4961-8733_t